MAANVGNEWLKNYLDEDKRRMHVYQDEKIDNTLCVPITRHWAR